MASIKPNRQTKPADPLRSFCPTCGAVGVWPYGSVMTGKGGRQRLRTPRTRPMARKHNPSPGTPKHWRYPTNDRTREGTGSTRTYWPITVDGKRMKRNRHPRGRGTVGIKRGSIAGGSTRSLATCPDPWHKRNPRIVGRLDGRVMPPSVPERHHDPLRAKVKAVGHKERQGRDRR